MCAFLTFLRRCPERFPDGSVCNRRGCPGANFHAAAAIGWRR